MTDPLQMATIADDARAYFASVFESLHPEDGFLIGLFVRSLWLPSHLYPDEQCQDEFAKSDLDAGTLSEIWCASWMA